jgi:hypothetical protein
MRGQVKRLIIAAILSILLPASAYADDGWWDFLWRMDPKFMGPNFSFQFLCLDEDGTRKNCGGAFGILSNDPAISRDEIRQDLSVRVGFYFTYGEPFPQAPSNAPRLKAAKFQLFYHYHLVNHIRVGAGIGVLPIWGDVVPTDRSNLILTPISLVYSPFSGSISKYFFLRGELTRIQGGLNPPGPTSTTLSSNAEWNPSVGIGFDYRIR